MSLKEKISEDLKTAFKNKEEKKVGVLRLLLSAIKNKELEKRAAAKTGEEQALSDEEVLALAQSEVKKRKEAINQYTQGGRPELAAKEQEEIDIIQTYLPEQLAEEEVKKIVQEAVAKSGASSIKEMGAVMAVVMRELKGRADGNLVSALVKEALSDKNA